MQIPPEIIVTFSNGKRITLHMTDQNKTHESGSARHGLPNLPDIWAMLEVRNQRLTIAVVLLAALLVTALAGWRFMPVRVVEPVYVRDDGSGALQALAARSAPEFKADQKHTSHFLQRWVRQVQTINPELTRTNVQEANELVVGTAVRELRDLLAKEGVRERMERDPNLRRTVEIRSVAFPTPNAAIVFFAQTERSGAREPWTQRKAMTINFVFVPVETRAEIERNPIGIRITHFDLADDQAGSKGD